jgi:hypothetical protein
MNHRRPELPETWPPEIRSLISACWAPDPSERLTFDQICQRLSGPEAEALVAGGGKAGGGGKSRPHSGAAPQEKECSIM